MYASTWMRKWVCGEYPKPADDIDVMEIQILKWNIATQKQISYELQTKTHKNSTAPQAHFTWKEL